MNGFVRLSKEPERLVDSTRTTQIAPPPSDLSGVYGKLRRISDVDDEAAAFQLRRIVWGPAYENWFHGWCVKSRLRALLEMLVLQ